ncbi:DUF1853 family protein [Alkalimarinus alittae]|uniref:DUF1853 family protein n=1 Tax=Alkalimarinus alittae TaxID=2961619 RepID=A0ABY6N5Q2_9ALTE|nr:DUF1853 family protein [Alkalimarinus alittae]UZE97448.1 DUF1853 family protein [Alkalimarinus alittae]
MQNKCVRDLAWVVTSPSLIIQKANWPTVVDAAHDKWVDQWLLSLDQNPSPLLKHLSHEKSHFLGPYFESLWAFYLLSSPRFELIAKNLQANTAARTEGEFDFIVLDKEREQYLHQEIAIKFYLGFSKKNQLEFSDGENIWLGPQCRDRLDLKMSKMINTQLQLSQLDSGKQALSTINIDPIATSIEPQIIIKGYLFYPSTPSVVSPNYCNEAHQRGLWFTLKEFTTYIEENNVDAWAMLTKSEWVSAYTVNNSVNENTHNNDEQGSLFFNSIEMLEAVTKKVKTESRPWMIACLTKQHERYTEALRLFVVPDNWPHTSEPTSI